MGLDYREEFDWKIILSNTIASSAVYLKKIETFVNSQHNKNSIVFEYFKAYNFENQSKVIHFNFKNKIWNYDKHFQLS